MKRGERILLAHGSGSRLTQELVRDVFLPALDNPQLAPLSFGIGALPLGWDANSWPDLFLPGAPLPLGLGLTDPFGYASVTVPNPNPGGLTGVTALVQGVGIRAGALELSAPVVLQLQ